jgi:hypothetical protein
MSSIRLRNIASGVIVRVREEKAAALGAGWVSPDAPASPVKRKPGRPKKTI